VEDIPLEEYAESLGLPTVPHVKFIPGSKLKQAKNAPHPHHDSSGDERKKPASAKTKQERMFERKNQTVFTKHYEELHSGGNTAFKVKEDGDDDKNEDIFSKKRKVDWDTMNIPTGQLPVRLLVMLTLAFKTAITDCNVPESVIETSDKGRETSV
jgi:ATP-dependent RNA helicase DDX10/DBP4